MVERCDPASGRGSPPTWICSSLAALLLLLPLAPDPALAGGSGAPRGTTRRVITPRVPVIQPGCIPPGTIRIQPLPAAPPPAPRPPPRAARWSAQLTPLRALWVWGDDAVDLILDRPGARAALFDRAVPPRDALAPAVTLLFLDDPYDLFFRPRPGTPYEGAHVRNLLADLHVHGIEAHLVACAHPHWSAGGACLEQTISRVEQFNAGGTGDTAWDGIQLARAHRPGEAWEPYTPGPIDPDFWEALRADVALGGRLLEHRMPFGVVVGSDWAAQPQLEGLEVLRGADYLAILPGETAPDRILEGLKPWRELNVRFLVGLEVREPELIEGPPRPEVWIDGYRPLERTLSAIVQGMDLAAPFVGFGFSDLGGYLAMPADRVAEVGNLSANPGDAVGGTASTPAETAPGPPPAAAPASSPTAPSPLPAAAPGSSPTAPAVTPSIPPTPVR